MKRPAPVLRIVPPAPAAANETPLEAARRRHGGAFAADKGSTWKRKVGLFDDSTVLTRWLWQRRRDRT